MIKKIIIPAFIIIGIVLFDQLVKSWAVNFLSEAGTIAGIPGIFQFTYTENTGAAFSMLSGMRWLLILITAVAIVWIMSIIKRISHPFGRFALYMIIGGAIGNLIDRIRLGYVIDMIELTFMKFAIFNVADCFVSVGMVLFIVYVFSLHKKESLLNER